VAEDPNVSWAVLPLEVPRVYLPPSHPTGSACPPPPPLQVKGIQMLLQSETGDHVGLDFVHTEQVSVGHGLA